MGSWLKTATLPVNIIAGDINIMKYGLKWLFLLIFWYRSVQNYLYFLPSYDMLSDIYLVALSTSTPVLNHQ